MARLETVILPQDDGKPVRRVALGVLGMSSGQFKRAKFGGGLWLDEAPVHADARVHEGQRLVIDTPESAPYTVQPWALRLRIAYEDEQLLVVDKPAPLASVASLQKADGMTLENAVYAHLGCPAEFCYHPVNRLDKGTSGLMAVAKTAHAQQRLQRLLHTDAFLREYLAVCEGEPPQDKGVIDLPIGKEDAASIRRVVRADGQSAVTHYRVLEKQNGRSLVRLRLETGRTHQIRVHLSALGCPICGDFLYGTELDVLPRRFALHSCALRVIHPTTGQIIVCESPLPQALRVLLYP